MSYPTLGIMLFTYNRIEYAKATIRACLDNIRYSGDIIFHIADDGSSEEYRKELLYFAGCWANITHLGVSNSQRGGYGASYNAATMLVHPRAEIVLPLEDDWKLERPLELDPLVRVLMTEPSIGCIRMGYVGYIPGQVLRGTFLWSEGQHFLVFDPYSPSQYVFSGHPRLETVEWARGVGPWPEGLPAGETELAVAGRLASRNGVAWPLDLIHPKGDLWSHIGTHAVKNEPLEARA